MALHYHETDQYEEIIEKTIVHFGDIPDRVIDEYVKSGEPLLVFFSKKKLWKYLLIESYQNFWN